MDFTDLDFKAHPNWPDGIRAKAEFPNGYGVSVIRGQDSYGGDEGLYELAVLREDEVVYDTPITDDVEGWLTEEAVTELLHKVEALPSKQST